MEEGVVEVGFGANLVQSSSIPAADPVDEVLAEFCALLILAIVVEIDLMLSVSSCTHLSCHDQPEPKHPSKPRSPGVSALQEHPCPLE